MNFFIGVADGVGGWRAYGIDPGEFSMHLMRTCERLVKLGRYTPNNPSDLLARSYYELLHHKKAILGNEIDKFNLENKCYIKQNNILRYVKLKIKKHKFNNTAFPCE